HRGQTTLTHPAAQPRPPAPASEQPGGILVRDSPWAPVPPPHSSARSRRPPTPALAVWLLHHCKTNTPHALPETVFPTRKTYLVHSLLSQPSWPLPEPAALCQSP